VFWHAGELQINNPTFGTRAVLCSGSKFWILAAVSSFARRWRVLECMVYFLPEEVEVEVLLLLSGNTHTRQSRVVYLSLLCHDFSTPPLQLNGPWEKDCRGCAPA
jgi:hypothetical protein